MDRFFDKTPACEGLEGFKDTDDLNFCVEYFETLEDGDLRPVVLADYVEGYEE